MNNLIYNNKIYELYKLSTKILEETFEKKYNFPVNIYKIAERLNIDVLETNDPTWNKCEYFKHEEYHKKFIDKDNIKPLNALLMKDINFLTYEERRIIQVSDNITEDYKRYSIAYLISSLLLNGSEKNILMIIYMIITINQ